MGVLFALEHRRNNRLEVRKVMALFSINKELKSPEKNFRGYLIFLTKIKLLHQLLIRLLYKLEMELVKYVVK